MDRRELIDALERLAALRDQGVLSEDEFAKQRDLLLSEGRRWPAPAPPPPTTPPGSGPGSDSDSDLGSGSRSLALSRGQWILLAIAVLVPIGLVIKALGDGSDSDSSRPFETAETSGVTDAAPITPYTYVTPATDVATSPPATATPPTESGDNPFGGDSPEDSLMPDVVCMDLQQAQNEIQDHGVFFSRSEDATGEGRRQIIDSNWIVVGQTPAAGTPIGERDAVLSVVKDDEPNSC